MNNDATSILNEDTFFDRSKSALKWLKRSFDVNQGQASSAYYSRFWKPFGWAPVYPETTGYIIETLYDYHPTYPNLNLDAYAVQATDWIANLQLPTGALPGGVGVNSYASVFNTGQMLIGLLRAYEHTNQVKYLEVIQKAVIWLIESLNSDGSWTVGAYTKDYVPSYYTRVIWPVLWANSYICDQTVSQSMLRALDYYKSKITPFNNVKDWAFRPQEQAFTHTIAYTIRGFYESSLLLEDAELNHLSIGLAERILTKRETKGRLAGRYDESWNGDYRFICLTGNCQLAIIFVKIFEQTKDIRFFNTALKLFEDVLVHQNINGSINEKGAIAGSAPFWGRYMALRYPNWSAKFFLDAYLMLHRCYKEMEKIIEANLDLRA